MVAEFRDKGTFHSIPFVIKELGGFGFYCDVVGHYVFSKLSLKQREELRLFFQVTFVNEGLCHAFFKSRSEVRNSNVNIFESVASPTEFVYNQPRINWHARGWYSPTSGI